MPKLGDDDYTGKDMMEDAEREKTEAEKTADLLRRVADLEDRVGALETKGFGDG